MAVQFRDSELSLSETLTSIAHSLDGDTITLRQLMSQIGEQGLLLLCMFLIIPFLIPVSIPGVSTVFGAAIGLIGVGITLNRLPWMPARLLDRKIETKDLIPTLEKGAKMVTRIDRIIRPRLMPLTSGAFNRLNGLALIFSALLLMVPFGFVPFSNTLPGIAILLLAAGMIQRDGLLILLGYVFIIITVIYFGALALGAIAAGQGISSLIGSGMILPMF